MLQIILGVHPVVNPQTKPADEKKKYFHKGGWLYSYTKSSIAFQLDHGVLSPASQQEG